MDKQNKALRGLQKSQLAALLCFACGFIFILWKARYGFAYSDENFYLAVPYRLYQGDALLAHEWNSAQLFAFLLYPAMELFMGITGSTEGIFLCFRYLYCAAQLAAAVYVYFMLRRFQPLGALIAAMLLLLYAPLQIMSLSYNSMCIILLAGALATICTCRSTKLPAYLSGLLFAGAVLCCPFLIALYLLYSALCLIPAAANKLNLPAFSPSFWLRFTLACAALAALFFAFVLSRSSLSDVIRSLPYAIANSESTNEGFVSQILKYPQLIQANFWFDGYVLSWPILAAVMALDKKRIEHRLYYIIPAMFITAGYFAYFILNTKLVNHLMFPMNILGGFAFFLCRSRDRRPFVFFYIPGLIFSLCIHFASNLGLANISSAMSISCVASCIYILTLAKELSADQAGLFPRLTSCALLLALLMQLGVLVWFRSEQCIWDENRQALDSIIAEGPQKGIVTTRKNAERYYSLIEETRPMREANADTALYIYTDNWIYMMDDARSACFSPWVSFQYPDFDMAYLEKYLEFYPEKVPEIAFIGNTGRTVGMLEELLPGEWSVEITGSGCILRPR